MSKITTKGTVNVKITFEKGKRDVSMDTLRAAIYSAVASATDDPDAVVVAFGVLVTEETVETRPEFRWEHKRHLSEGYFKEGCPEC